MLSRLRRREITAGGQDQPRPSTKWASFVVVQQREHVMPSQLLAAVEEIQLHHESQAGYFRAQGLGQLYGGVGGAAGGQQVVHDNDSLRVLDSVFVHLQRIAAIFEFVGYFGGFRRQLFGLAHGNESSIQAIRQRRAEDESAGLDAQHQVNFLVQI